MEKRIVFNSKEPRDLFFKKALESFKLVYWFNLQDLLHLKRFAFSSYRAGKLSLPKKYYDFLISQMSFSDREFFNKNISILNDNWGQVKAGRITYGRHKSSFDLGRKKAIFHQKFKVNSFNLNLPLDVELSHFIGLFIGDGFMNHYLRYYLIQFTGDKRTETTFYQTYIFDSCKKLFNLEPHLRFDKNGNALRFNLYSKCLYQLLNRRFKIAAGRKSRTVLIPKEILNSKPMILKACIRGLYDAEGCVFFDNRKFYTLPYPRIELHMCNLALLRQVSLILKKFGIDNVLGTNRNNLRVTIYGTKNVKKFVEEIGFMNPKQLKKLDFLKD